MEKSQISHATPHRRRPHLKIERLLEKRKATFESMAMLEEFIAVSQKYLNHLQQCIGQSPGRSSIKNSIKIAISSCERILDVEKKEIESIDRQIDCLRSE